MKRIVLFFCFILLVSSLFAQRSKKRRSSRDYWPSYQHTASIGLGGTYFYGDILGGPFQRAPIPDGLQPETIRYAVTGTYKYKFHPRMNFRVSLSYARISGADSITSGKQSRNLSFRSQLIEFSPMIEYYVVREKFPTKMRWGRWMANRKPSKDFSWYFATGITALYFNPMAKYQNEWVELQPLGTEGQGLDGTEKYNRVGFGIPACMGFKVMYNQKWSFGFETGMRFMFTDYLDDVSTDYYDQEVLSAVNGPLAAALGNRSTRGNSSAGSPRGNPGQNDSYLFAQITISRKIRPPR
jgi:hypothetical protein